jgi:hypothetical protein
MHLGKQSPSSFTRQAPARCRPNYLVPAGWKQRRAKKPRTEPPKHRRRQRPRPAALVGSRSGPQAQSDHSLRRRKSSASLHQLHPSSSAAPGPQHPTSGPYRAPPPPSPPVRPRSPDLAHSGPDLARVAELACAGATRRSHPRCRRHRAQANAVNSLTVWNLPKTLGDSLFIACNTAG